MATISGRDWNVLTRDELLVELGKHPDLGPVDPHDPTLRYTHFRFDPETGIYDGFNTEETDEAREA